MLSESFKCLQKSIREKNDKILFVKGTTILAPKIRGFEQFVMHAEYFLKIYPIGKNGNKACLVILADGFCITVVTLHKIIFGVKEVLNVE